jgi:outer membrane biosynthesis protein TonB
MIMRISLAALAATFTLAATANADHRPRKHRYFISPVEILTSSVDPFIDEDDEEWIDDEGNEELTLREMRERRKRWSRVNEDPWWLEDEDLEEEEPAPKPVKKKSATAKPKVTKPAVAATPPKPKVKPEKAASAPAAKKTPVVAKAAAPIVPKTQTARLDPKVSLPEDKKVTVAKPKTASAPKPSGKTVGCTGGAAIVTGLGFASVRPRVCTGDTFAYLATKSDGTYAIKLKAATGEVVDVAKLP